MAKSGANYSVSKLVDEEDVIDSESPRQYNNSQTVGIRSLLDARLVYTGQVSGKQYTWSKAGDIVMVEDADSEVLLAKRIGSRQCCGNSKDGNKVFELV
jgi:hypothetical protein